MVYSNGYHAGRLHTNRGTKGGGGFITTNEVEAVVAILAKLPQNAPPKLDEHRISVEWGAGTNSQLRVYDRANPPDELLRLYQLSEGQFDQPVALLKPQQEHDFTGKFATVAAAGQDIILVGRERVSAWNWKTGRQLYRIEEAPEIFYIDGDYPVRLATPRAGVFVCARSRKVSMHDLASGQELWSHFEPERFRGKEYIAGLFPGPVCLSPDGNTILVVERNDLRRYSRVGGTNFTAIAKFERGIASMDFSGDGRFIAAAGRPVDPVEFILAEREGKKSELVARTADFTHVRLLKPDGTSVASFPQPREVLSMAFSPDSRWLAVLNWTRWEVRIYDTATLALDGTMPVWVHGGMRFNDLNHVVWSPDGRFLALSGKGLAVVVCDMKRRLPVARSAGAVSSQVCFSPDSSAVIAQQNAEKLYIFDLAEFR